MERENLELVRVCDLTEKEILAVDNFIMDMGTQGEFINSIKYLSYHPEGRFIDDSVIVRDAGSRNLLCVMMAAEDPDDEKIIISHPGTTFGGPVFQRKTPINDVEIILDVLFDYYKNKYDQVIIKTPPMIYQTQPFGTLDYYLLRHGFTQGTTGLSNCIRIGNFSRDGEVYQNFQQKRRNQVKKVVNKGMFVFSKGDEIREEVWHSMEENLATKFGAKATHTIEEIKELQSRFPNNILAFYTDTQDGEYGAFGLIYKFKNVIHTQYLDTNYKYTGEYPNLLLINELIGMAMDEGFEYFNFGVSTERHGEYLNEGLYSYKAGYGGGDVLMPEFIWKK